MINEIKIGRCGMRGTAAGALLLMGGLWFFTVQHARAEQSVQPLIDLSLALDQTTYELDEQYKGTVSLINRTNAAINSTLTVELLKEGVRVAAVPIPTPLLPGTTPLPLKDIGNGRINADPAFVGNWTLRFTLAAPGHSARTVQSNYAVIMPRAVTVTVNGASTIPASKVGNGFLSIRTIEGAPAPSAIAALRPAFWRLSWYWKGVTDNLHRSIRALYPEAKITVLIPDMIAIKLQLWDDRIKEYKPWLDWPTYDGHVREAVTHVLSVGTVDYWDLWSEPNWLFGGTRDQFEETVKRTMAVVRSIDPNAKFVGPSAGSLVDKERWIGEIQGEPIFPHLLDYLIANNLRLDAISWHEMGNPEDLQDDFDQMRKWFAERPVLCKPTCPEIHINEYSGPEEHIIPGWQVGWFSYLEKARPDWVSHACWDIEPNPPAVPTKYNDCVSGLNGLFLADSRTPQPSYWTHQRFSEIPGMPRLPVTSTSPRVVVIATKNDAEKSLTLLTGRYTCGKDGSWCGGGLAKPIAGLHAPSIPVTLKITNYTYAASGARVTATLQRIPNEGIPGPLLAPITLPTQTLIVDSGGAVTLSIPQYQDGDVYSIVVKPLTIPAPAITAVTPSSGPLGTRVTITGTGFTFTGNRINFAAVDNAIINLASQDGQTLIFTIPATPCDQLKGGVCIQQILAPGSYTLSVSNTNGRSNEKHFQVTAPVTEPVLTIDAASNKGAMRPRHGFFGTFVTDREPYMPNPSLVVALKPAIWRVLRYPSFKEISRLTKEVAISTDWWYSAAIKGTYITQCQHSTAYDGTWPPVCVQPQKDPDYIVYLEEYYDRYKNEAETKDGEVDYWLFWHELDAYGRFVPRQQNIEAFKAFKLTYDTLRRKDPNAKIIGPSFFPSYTDDPMFLEFIDFLAASSIKLDGFGWNRYGHDPAGLPDELNTLRAVMTSKGLCTAGCPPFFLYEYGDVDNYVIPGWAVAWLYYIEKADAKFAVRSDWEEGAGGGTLLGGLLNRDLATPRPAYWVHRAYALMDEGTLLSVVSSDAKIAALATLHPDTRSLLLLAGAFQAHEKQEKPNPKCLTIRVTGYPYGRGSKVSIVQYRLPGDIAVIRTPFPSPPLQEYMATVSTSGEIVLSVNNFQDGDAYIYFVRPAEAFGTPTPLIFDTKPQYILSADLNRDGAVNSLDWSIMNSQWGTAGNPVGPNADINGDGLVNSLDFSILNGEWGRTTQ